MAQNEKATSVGLRHVRVATRDDDGMATIPAGTAAGTAYAGVQVLKSRALTIQPAAAQRITASGDDAAYFTFNEPPTENPTGELRTQVTDMVVLALLTSTSIYGSGDQQSIAIASNKVGSEDPVLIWGYRKAKDTSVGEVYYGQQLWEMYFLLNCYATARPSPMNIQEIGELAFEISANNSSVNEVGQTFTEALHGCTEAAYIVVHTRYKPFVDWFEGDAAQTTFTLTQGANTVYNVATSPVRVYVDGVATAKSVSAAGVVTISPAPADGAKIAVFYEFED